MRSDSEVAWSRSLVCTAAEKAGIFGAAALSPDALDLIPGGRDDFFLAFGDAVVVLIASPAAARFLRLRIVAFERLGLHEEHVGAGEGMGIARGSVEADQIARRQLEILQRDHG